MSHVAIIGAGDLGGAIAHAIASRGLVRSVTIIDDAAGVAAGKALDIRQSGPIDRSDVRVDGASDVLAAVGASVIVLADAVGSGEWRDDRGLTLVGRLMRAGTESPIVFAGAHQHALMQLAARELAVPIDRMIGTASSAVVGTVRSLVGLELDGSGKDVAVVVTGRPPKAVVAWSSGTAGGMLLSERVAPHRLHAISQSLPRFWPPSPRAVAAPTARIVEALISGSRTPHQAAVILDGEFGARGSAALLPVVLGRGRILGRMTPSLSPQERTEAITAFADRIS